MQAANLYYDANGTGGGAALNYGDGIWSTTQALWLSGVTAGTAGGTYSGWSNSSSDLANIGAGSGYTAATGPFTITLGENLTMSGITVSGNLTQNLLIAGTTSNYTLTIGSAGVASNQTVASGATTTIDAILTTASGTPLLKNNAGTIILTRSNSYTSGTNIQGGTGNSGGGTLQIGNGGTTGALGIGSVSFLVNGTQSLASTLSFNRSDAVTVNNVLSINSANTTVGGIIQQAGSNKLTLTGSESTGSAATNSAVLTYNIGHTAGLNADAEVTGVVGGTGSTAKTGTGILLLSGANTYGGTTTINGGMLFANNTTGSATGTGTVTVNSGGTLGGGNGAANSINAATPTSGATTTLGTGNNAATSKTYVGGAVGLITGPVTVASGGSLAPGRSAVGTLTVGALTLNGGSTAAYEFNTTNGTNDLTAVTGSLTLSSTAANPTAITLLQEGTATAYAATGTYNLFSYGSLASAFDATTLSVANAQSGLNYTFVNDTTDSLIQLDITAVPEPATWLGGAFCVCALAYALRHRIAGA